MNVPVPPAPQSIFLNFVGPITYPATKIFRNVFCYYFNGGVKNITLLLNSSGGTLQEGFSLYYFLKSLPIELTIYNVGAVESIAVAVFLAGKNRYATAASRFMLHDFVWPIPNPETLSRQQYGERKSLLEQDARHYAHLLKLNTLLTDKTIKSLKFHNKLVIVDAEHAKRIGVIQDIAEPTVPAGAPIYNIDY